MMTSLKMKKRKTASKKRNMKKRINMSTHKIGKMS